MRRPAILGVLAVLCATIAGCGEDEAGGSGERPRLTVSAATSLKAAVTEYAGGFEEADVRLSFAGSDELAAQIRQGIRPDVFASANTTLPEELAKEGLVEQPVDFAGNRLVLATPADADDPVRSLSDLTAGDVRIAMGAKTVPVGAYTRKVLARLPTDQRKAILGNVRSNEPDVGGVVGKLSQGAVDAGFVYITDVAAAGGKLSATELPADLQPTVTYAAAVVKGAKQPDAARRFLDGLVRGKGQDALRAAGFSAPPG